MTSLFARILRSLFVISAVLVVLAFTPGATAAPFAAYVIDARTGEVLYEKNANSRLHPASLTKMMTLYITFQEIEAGRLSLDTMITVSKHAASEPPSRLGLKPGQKIALRYLIRAAAVKSANDAATTIGEAIGGSEAGFAKRMTRTARQLGMNDTTFRNANGLTAEGHLSTAHDMTMLGRHLFYDFPQYYNIFSRRTADAGVAQVRNTNSRFLDSYEGADGIKTGYTSPAGFNLVASAQRGNKRIIAAVFGGTSTAMRNAKMVELLDLGFGAARNRVAEKKPVAPAIPDNALLAAAEPEIDVPDAEGGGAKILNVSGEVRVSPRPKARPTVAAVRAEVAIAMATSIDGALAIATAEPPPEGTLEHQVAQLAQGDSAAAPPPPVQDAPEDATPVELAAADIPAAPGTLQAQAETLGDATAEAGPTPLVAESGTLEAQAEALAATDTAVADLTVDPALAALKPMPRPDAVAIAAANAALAEPSQAEVALAEAAPTDALSAEALPADVPAPALIAAEVVITDPGIAPSADETLLADAAIDSPAMPEVTFVETVAGATNAPPPALLAETALAVAPRQSPIFESVEPAAPADVVDQAVEQEVVLVMSTSGGRHWGVNVGTYNSRYDAERALLKTALAESATLNDGLRKISQKGGTWHANFMGLTEEQADLACRRLHARAIVCETLGP